MNKINTSHTAHKPLKAFHAKLLKPFLAFGPLALSVFILCCGLLILTSFRIALTALYLPRLEKTPDFLWLFIVGLRMDLILLCIYTIAPTVLALLLPGKLWLKARPLVAAWFTVLMCLLVYMEISTFPFMDEFDLRPDQKFLEYLQHVKEVVTTLVKVYAFELSIGAMAILVSALFFWRSVNYLLLNTNAWNHKTRIATLTVATAFMFLGIRSTLGHRPANVSTAYFSQNHLANEIALNSTYTMFYAAYRMLRHEHDPAKDYGEMSNTEVFARVSSVNNLEPNQENKEIPFLKTQSSPFKYERPPNIVIFLQESMGASDVGCLSGPPITPNLCRLREEGLWLSNLYATGTRTVRGIEATISGFLPTAAIGVLKLERAKKGFFTAASLLKKHGYSTNFIYGGMSNFDEMRSFFMGNGFDEIYDQPTFVDPVLEGTWGVSDEDLVRKANQVYASHGDKPFFSLILSTSNHTPYEFPDGRIELYEQPKQTHFNAIKYADYSIGLFFELAKKEQYYKNTIFLVVADHNSHVRGNDHVPVSKFHIPGLIIGPNVPKTELTLLASQIDLLPTLLHFSGLNTEHPMIGRNLLALPEGTKGRAFMQFASNNAYRIEDDVVVLRPSMPPEQFKYKNNELLPSEENHEMIQDALAHAHLPWILYSEKRYKLPSLETALETN